MAAPIVLSDATFSLVVDAQPLVIVDFWAPWCGPCRALGPVIDRLAERYEGRVTFAKLNIDENAAIQERFRILSIPAVLFFRNGRLVDRSVGALPESLMQVKVEQLLKAAATSPRAA